MWQAGPATDGHGRAQVRTLRFVDGPDVVHKNALAATRSEG